MTVLRITSRSLRQSIHPQGRLATKLFHMTTVRTRAADDAFSALRLRLVLSHKRRSNAIRITPTSCHVEIRPVPPLGGVRRAVRYAFVFRITDRSEIAANFLILWGGTRNRRRWCYSYLFFFPLYLRLYSKILTEEVRSLQSYPLFPR